MKSHFLSVRDELLERYREPIRGDDAPAETAAVYRGHGGQVTGRFANGWSVSETYCAERLEMRFVAALLLVNAGGTNITWEEVATPAPPGEVRRAWQTSDRRRIAVLEQNATGDCLQD